MKQRVFSIEDVEELNLHIGALSYANLDDAFKSDLVQIIIDGVEANYEQSSKEYQEFCEFLFK